MLTYAVYGAVFSFNHSCLSELDHFLSWKYCIEIISNIPIVNMDFKCHFK